MFKGSNRDRSARIFPERITFCLVDRLPSLKSSISNDASKSNSSLVNRLEIRAFGAGNWPSKLELGFWDAERTQMPNLSLFMSGLESGQVGGSTQVALRFDKCMDDWEKKLHMLVY